MKIYVEKVTRYTVADAVSLPSYSQVDRVIGGQRKQAVEVSVRVIVEDETEMANWEAAVGQTLQVVPEDVQPSGWDRCG